MFDNGWCAFTYIMIFLLPSCRGLGDKVGTFVVTCVYIEEVYQVYPIPKLKTVRHDKQCSLWFFPFWHPVGISVWLYKIKCADLH